MSISAGALREQITRLIGEILISNGVVLRGEVVGEVAEEVEIRGGVGVVASGGSVCGFVELLEGAVAVAAVTGAAAVRLARRAGLCRTCGVPCTCRALLRPIRARIIVSILCIIVPMSILLSLTTIVAVSVLVLTVVVVITVVAVRVAHVLPVTLRLFVPRVTVRHLILAVSWIAVILIHLMGVSLS